MWPCALALIQRIYPHRRERLVTLGFELDLLAANTLMTVVQQQHLWDGLVVALMALPPARVQRFAAQPALGWTGVVAHIVRTAMGNADVAAARAMLLQAAVTRPEFGVELKRLEAL